MAHWRPAGRTGLVPSAAATQVQSEQATPPLAELVCLGCPKMHTLLLLLAWLTQLCKAAGSSDA